MNLEKIRAPATVAISSALLSALLLQRWPTLELDLFCRGAGELAALLSGSPLLRIEHGWLLPAASPAVVTAACSGTTYFVLLAGLLAWHLQQRLHRPMIAVVAGIVCALPAAIAINALRVAAVLQAHRWLLPLFPDSFRAFLHLLTGVAVFLPALIVINLLAESHGRTRITSRD